MIKFLKRRPKPTATEATDRKNDRRKGQSMLIVGLMLTLLMLFAGLGIDAGNLMGRSAKLQSAVDTAALSAAQTLSGGGITTTATTKAYQILEANGIPSSTLSLRVVDFPGFSQVRVHVVQRVDTYFMRLIPAWRQVDVGASATADLSSYAEITTKPYGQPGVVNELNLMVWGRSSYRRGGDAFSPRWGVGGPPGTTLNPQYDTQPYGYLFRIDVPPGYSSRHLLVELFDPDSYNRPGAPPAWPTCSPAPCTTPTPTADMYASCSSPGGGTCTSNSSNDNTAMKLSAFPGNGRPAFWRVDEIRSPYTDTTGIQGVYNSGYATTTQYTIWHYNPHITSAFGDPTTLSDQPGGAYLARYSTGWNTSTDLSWYRPSGFDIALQDGAGNDLFEREGNGGMYFYMYVQGVSGSSENNWDVRVGPPELNGGGCSTPCYVNTQYLTGSPADWQDGGANVFAKQSLPLNLVTGASFPLAFTQVSKNAAGQVLGVRHFDQDCNNGCGSTMQYQMQKCIPSGGTYTPCSPLTNANCWSNIGVGYVGDNDSWTDGTHPDPEPVVIPVEGSAGYTTFFGPAGECATSWLRIQSNPSYSGDTTTWQMPYIRPRLLK